MLRLVIYVLKCCLLHNPHTSVKKKKPSHIVCEEVAPAGCAVKLNVTGGMARS